MRLAPIAAASLGLFSAACLHGERAAPGPGAAPPAASASAPSVAQEPAPIAGGVLKGKVLEKLDASMYSYLRLGMDSGEAWVAVPQGNAEIGSEVTITGAAPMRGFESKALKRKFALVYFGMIAPPEGGAGNMEEATRWMASQHQTLASGPAGAETAAEVKKVARADGPDGRTVEEVWAQKVALKGKTVSVRGQVVKSNSGIMGRNWLHLRDGSGTAEKSNHDVTVTTMDQASVGEVVTATGTVQLDRQFGPGYAYPVIVEDAKIAR